MRQGDNEENGKVQREGKELQTTDRKRGRVSITD